MTSLMKWHPNPPGRISPRSRDLSGVTYMDSSGIASLVEAYQCAKKQGAEFSLVRVNPAALRVLKLARLDKVFIIHENLEKALNADI